MPSLRAGGHRIHVAWAGDFHSERDTVVYLHDGLGSMAAWKDVPEHIGRATRTNSLLYDRWGYGRSDERPSFDPGFMEVEVPTLLELAQQQVQGPMHLVGHSDGGSIALLFASHHPPLTRSVVAVAPHSFVENRTRSTITQLLEAADEGELPGWISAQHGSRGAALLRSWARCWLSAEHARWTIAEQLDSIDCPVFVVQGDADEYGTAAQVDTVLRHVRNASAWTVPVCGHAPHLERHAAFIERVSAFVADAMTAR